MQVLDLGQIKAVESWHEGGVRYEKLVTIPDYDRSSGVGWPSFPGRCVSHRLGHDACENRPRMQLLAPGQEVLLP